MYKTIWLFINSQQLMCSREADLQPNVLEFESGGQMAEWLGSWAINQKVVGLIPGRAKGHSVLGQGTSPYLKNVPVLLYLL